MICVSRLVSDLWRVDKSSRLRWTDTRTTVREQIFSGTVESTGSFSAFKRAVVRAIEAKGVRPGYTIEYQQLVQDDGGDYFVVIEEVPSEGVVHVLLSWP